MTSDDVKKETNDFHRWKLIFEYELNIQANRTWSGVGGIFYYPFSVLQNWWIRVWYASGKGPTSLIKDSG